MYVEASGVTVKLNIKQEKFEAEGFASTGAPTQQDLLLLNICETLYYYILYSCNAKDVLVASFRMFAACKDTA